jgi:hypothetical protein
MDLSLLIFTLETYRFSMKCIKFTTRTYNFKNLAVGSLIWSAKPGVKSSYFPRKFSTCHVLCCILTLLASRVAWAYCRGRYTEDFRPQAREIIKLRGVGMADSNGMNHERITLRDLGHLPHERALTIDENQNVVICGRDGKWVKTGEKLSPRPADVLQDSLWVPDVIQQNNFHHFAHPVLTIHRRQSW